MPAAAPRILSVTLPSGAPLDAMADFYAGALGLPVERAGEVLTVRVGPSTLRFTPTDDHAARSHFAFNIPAGAIRAAHAWLRDRVALVVTPREARDAGLPDEVRHFPAWNAHALYCLDPAGHVVEWIARHDLPDAQPGSFTAADMQCVSEIALGVEDVHAAGDALADAFGLAQYRGATDDFRAMGDERGLLLCFRSGGVMIPDVPVRTVPLRVRIASERAGRVTLADGAIVIESR
ncbi:MAG: VOC family protein [Phycisphaerales bacterium]